MKPLRWKKTVDSKPTPVLLGERKTRYLEARDRLAEYDGDDLDGFEFELMKWVYSAPNS